MKPQRFEVVYRGEPIEFTRLEAKGYLYRCPVGNHRAHNWIDTESGTRHTLTFDALGRPTIRASMLCAQGCGWHVFVTNGVAVDA